MEAHFTMTPEAKEFLYGPGEKPEYVVYGPVDIEVELMSGEINRPQEIRERVTRCSGCIHATDGYDGGLWCEGFECSTEPDGFCKWGVRRENR